MTIIGPILMAAIFIVPVYIAQIEGEMKVIGVIDETGLFVNKFTSGDQISFINVDEPLEEAKTDMDKNGFYAILHIPRSDLNVPESAIIYSSGQPNIIVKGVIKNTMRKEVELLKLNASGLDPNVLKSIRTSINLLTIKINKEGYEEKTSTELSMAVGMISGFLIYIFIFMYGAQVMRGVIEEKTSRIIEVIISSVKPFQLMMGKIVGVAMVGLTQFILWIIATLILVSTFMAIFSDDISIQEMSQMKMQSNGIMQEDVLNHDGEPDGINQSAMAIFESIQSINFGLVLGSFLFFFIGGYLLYGALFAAIGSAVDGETDTQQFMIPITVPLILSIALAQFIIQDPDGPVAFWLSIFPLTSPVIMMVRIPFGVPYLDLILAIAMLILGFLGTTWLAAKIYRTGILMYGKKINYQELWKWIRYK